MARWTEPWTHACCHPSPKRSAMCRARSRCAETVLPLLVQGDALVVAVPTPGTSRCSMNCASSPGCASCRCSPWRGRSRRRWREPTRRRHSPSAPRRPPKWPAAAFAQRDVHQLAAELVKHDAQSPELDSTIVSESDNTLVRLINTLITNAIRHRASDIHIETADAPGPTRIRLRVDGTPVLPRRGRRVTASHSSPG